MRLFFAKIFRRSALIPPMPLGRWCHPQSHTACDQQRKADLATQDNSCSVQTPAAVVEATRDPVSIFVCD